jgi:hypothetical protein
MGDEAGAAQYQPTVEELVAAIKEVKEKNPEFGIKRVHKELKVRPRAWAARAVHASPTGGCGGAGGIPAVMHGAACGGVSASCACAHFEVRGVHRSRATLPDA